MAAVQRLLHLLAVADALDRETLRFQVALQQLAQAKVVVDQEEGGRGGIGVFFGVTWGFLIGWPVVAGLIGWLTYRLGAPYSIWKGTIINLFFGMVVLYAIGIPGMVVTGKLGWGAALAANLPYLPGDLIKCVLAAFVAKAVHSAYPGLLPWRGNAVEPAPPNL